MKIAFLMQQIITGGIENILVNILRELKKYPEYEITVISSKKVTEKKFLDFFAENNINLIDDNFFMPFQSSGIKGKISKLTQCIKKYRVRKQLQTGYDVIVDYFNGNFGFVLRKVNAPKVAFMHLSIDAYYKAHSSVKSHLEIYDKIVSISKSFYNDLIKDYPDKKEKFEMIYNPVDIEYIQKFSKKRVIKAKAYFTTVARLAPEKDHETLIYAFAKFLHQEKYPDVKLYVLGEGPLQEKWQNLCIKLNVDAYVEFLGNVLNPYQYVNGAMANILSSFGEGLPTVLIEAQAVNTLNIASNVKSGIAEILLDGEGGLLFEPGNTYDLANKMSDIYHKKINKTNMIKKSNEALNRFDVKTIISQLDDLFKKMVQLKKGK